MNVIQKIIADNSITNFSEEEILNGYPEKNIPVNLIPNIAPTLKLLQLIRTDIQVPIKINSTFRNVSHNDHVGGASNSLHLSFNAIDFAPVGCTPESLQHIYNDLLRGKYAVDITFKGSSIHVTHLKCGFGLYHSFIHIDTRGLLNRLSPSAWRG